MVHTKSSINSRDSNLSRQLNEDFYPIKERISSEEPQSDTVKKSENKGLWLFALSMVVIGMSSFQIKWLIILYPEDYDPYSFAVWRSIGFLLIPYYIMRKNNVYPIHVREIQNKFWFCVRTFGQFICFIAYVKCLSYLRVSTTNCIASMNPALVVILSTLILKEKFHMRYIYGIVICFFGTLLIILNDRKTSPIMIEDVEYPEEYLDPAAQTGEIDNFLNVIYGGFWGFINLMLIAMMSVSAKILMKENLGFENQMFYLGVTNMISALFSLLFVGKFTVNLGFIIGVVINSVIFLASQYLVIEALKFIDLNKTTPLAYVATLTVFLLGATILGETIFFTDIIGSLIILSYNIYNSFFPVKNK